jgi:hypothetical protein
VTIAAGTPTIDGYPEIVWTMQPWVELKATEPFIDENNGKTAAYEDDDMHNTRQGDVCTPSDGVIYAVQTKAGG